MRRSSSLLTTTAVALCAAACGCLWAAPAPRVSLRLRQQPVVKVAAELAQALGAPVRVEGERKAPVSVELTDVSGREALEAVAAAVDGEWQRLFVLSGQGKGGGAGRFPSGRLVTLSLEDVSAATAATTIAKAAGARLELEAVPDKTLSVVAESEPVEAVLDRLAKAAGLQWRQEYVLTVAEPAPTPAATPKAGKTGSGPATGSAARSGAAQRGGATGSRGNTRVPPAALGNPSTRKSGPTQPVGGQLLTGMPADRALVQDGIYSYIFQLPRAKREPFIQQLADELKQTEEGKVTPSNPAQAQLLFEHRMRRQAILKNIRALPAAHQKELQPIVDVLSQGMPTGTEPGIGGTAPRP